MSGIMGMIVRILARKRISMAESVKYQAHHARGVVEVTYDSRDKFYEIWETVDSFQHYRGRTKIFGDAARMADECAALFDDLTEA